MSAGLLSPRLAVANAPAGAVSSPTRPRQVLVKGEAADLQGLLISPDHPTGTVIVLGDGTRDGGQPAFVARRLREGGLATLMVGLPDRPARQPGLAQQLVALAHWVARQPETARLPVGVCTTEGAMTVAVAAATLEPASLEAIVVRGGIPGGVRADLRGLHAATLFLIESDDPRDALRTTAAVSGLHGDIRVVDLRRTRVPALSISHAELAANWTAEWLLEHLTRVP